MAITGLSLDLWIGSASGAGTDGDLYLGIGGREFYLDYSAADDFERDSHRRYTFGRSLYQADNWPRTVAAEFNDPTRPVPMTEEDITSNPVYLRFRGQNRDDNVQIENAQVLVWDNAARTSGSPPTFSLRKKNIWLGTRRGESVTLVQDLA